MKRFLIIIILIFAMFELKSQTVRNVNFTVQGNDIYITYDLIDNGENSRCYIELYYSTDNGISWKGPISKNAIGDIGYKVNVGPNKKIIWKPLLSLPWLFSDYVMFKVRVKKGTKDFAETIKDLNLDMVFVEGGTFIMGCTSEQGNDCYDYEKPTHEVTLSDFYIGKFEVTQAQWKAVMGNNPSYFSGCDNCPVEQVSWNDIQDFLKKLNQLTGKNYRLPTEAEWEYAARGGALAGSATATKYSGSNNISNVAWYDDNSSNKTHPVGQKKANELGLYDMSGNVWEWCSDWYGDYSTSAQTNPTGPSSGSSRVLRGGSCYSFARNCRVSDRYSYNPDNRYYSDGFRVVLFP